MNNNVVEASVVEASVADYLQVQVEEVRGKSKKSACVKARHYSIYFLHTKYGYTGGQLSKLYNITRHHVFDVCALMDTYRRIDSNYRKELSEVETILDGI